MIKPGQMKPSLWGIYRDILGMSSGHRIKISNPSIVSRNSLFKPDIGNRQDYLSGLNKSECTMF